VRAASSVTPPKKGRKKLSQRVRETKSPQKLVGSLIDARCLMFHGATAKRRHAECVTQRYKGSLQSLQSPQR
jgi:hypothetical protein